MDPTDTGLAEVRGRGQTLVVFALGLVALLAMVALIIDGGNAYAQQRAGQNATDAASEAGAVVLMEKLVGVVPAKTGNDVYNAVVASLATSSASTYVNTLVRACYTDTSGQPLDASGNVVSDCATAAQVTAGGSIPSCASCPGLFASGVRVYANRSFGTLVASVIGLNSFTASTTATAIAGFVNAYPGNVIPVTIPLLATGCDGSGNAIAGTIPWPVGPNNVLSVPLCKGGPGNVGWIDWTPTAGGASELATAIATPNNPAITTPGWYYIMQTGEVNSSQVQTAMDSWNGKVIFIPIFNTTCGSLGNGITLTAPGQQVDCTNAGGTLGGGNGSNLWYYLVGFASFHLNQSFINGGDGGLCIANAYPGVPNDGGSTSCLIGYFTDDVAASGGSVGPGGGGNNQYSAPGVQLIR